jgi:regulatory protein
LHEPDAAEESGRDPAGLDRALGRAYAALNRRERTVAEMRSLLSRAGVDDVDADRAIAELRELGYLDDARYARVFAQDKRTLEQWGSERIARSLAQRGVARDVIVAALGTDAEQTDREQAIAILRRRFPQPPSDPRERERALGVLVRKGYDSDTAYDAVRAWSATAAG